MKCENCHAEISDDSRFCSQCGMPSPIGGFGNAVGLTSKSAETAGAWRSGDSFLPHGERRQVSIMFSDIIGSTALSESLDPEDLLAIIREYQAACSKVIGLYEGHLAKYLGDGIFSLLRISRGS